MDQRFGSEQVRDRRYRRWRRKSKFQQIPSNLLFPFSFNCLQVNGAAHGLSPGIALFTTGMLGERQFRVERYYQTGYYVRKSNHAP